MNVERFLSELVRYEEKINRGSSRRNALKKEKYRGKPNQKNIRCWDFRAGPSNHKQPYSKDEEQKEKQETKQEAKQEWR